MDGSRITGINTEDSSRDEGTVHYDIRFVVYIPSQSERVKMIIDVESQNKYNPGYDIIFYLSIPAGIDKVPVKEFVRRIANMYKMYNVGDFL